MVFLVSALAAAVVALYYREGGVRPPRAAQSTGMPIVVRCPQAADRRKPGADIVGWPGATADQVIAVARRVNHREVTHYQGIAERRTRWNTPVQGLVMNLSDH